MSFEGIERFKFNEGEYVRMTRSPGGPVVRDLSRRGIRIEAAAKNFASGNNGGPKVRSGRLRGSIHWRIEQDDLGAFLIVGSSVEYAGFVEYGTSRAKPYPYLRPALIAGIN